MAGGAGATAHADDTGPSSAQEQLGARLASEAELADAGAITLTWVPRVLLFEAHGASYLESRYR
jgi:hypothetical protein